MVDKVVKVLYPRFLVVANWCGGGTFYFFQTKLVKKGIRKW